MSEVFKATAQAMKDAENFLVEVGQEMVPLTSEKVPERIKAKYLRTVIRKACPTEE